MRKQTLAHILPLGSIVTLKQGTKKVMIIGRCQKNQATGIDYDYSSCYYPEGVLNPQELFLFQQEDIDKVYYIGMQDGEEFAFRDFMEQQLTSMRMIED